MKQFFPARPKKLSKKNKIKQKNKQTQNINK